MSEQTLYERLGKRDGIRAVVDDFYDRLLADEDLGPFFEDADMDLLRRTQTDFLCEAAGGPETYDATPVREAHLHLPFEPAHIQRAVELLRESLDAFDVPEDDADAVVGAVAAYEDDLLARPEDDTGTEMEAETETETETEAETETETETETEAETETETEAETE